MKTDEELIWESYTGRNRKYISADEIIANLDHHTPDDLEEGDLIDRIKKYDIYDTTILPLDDLNGEQWDYDEDRVEEYEQTLGSDYDPIIVHLKPEYAYHEIVDGTHRVNALKNRDEKYIRAYVGIK